MANKSSMLFISILGVMTALSLSISNAYGLTNVNNTYFSINIPDNWTYTQGSHSPVSDILGFGPSNVIAMTPNKFGVFLLEDKPLANKLLFEGAYASFQQDSEYTIKNSPLDLYVKYKLDKQDAMQVAIKQNVTVDGQPAVKVFADGTESLTGIIYLEYMLMHDKEPYYLAYMANAKDFLKYLPQFEQMVMTFRFTK